MGCSSLVFLATRAAAVASLLDAADREAIAAGHGKIEPAGISGGAGACPQIGSIHPVMDLAAQPIPCYRSLIRHTGLGGCVRPSVTVVRLQLRYHNLASAPQATGDNLCSQHLLGRYRTAHVPPAHRVAQAGYAGESPLSDGPVLLLAVHD